MRELLSISSVQKELADERKALRDFIMGNRLLSRHFNVFLFEDLPAKNRRPDNLYLDKVDQCSIFLAVYAKEHGWEAQRTEFLRLSVSSILRQNCQNTDWYS